MEVVEYQSAAEFLRECEEFLLQRETENNLPLGLANGMKGNIRQENDGILFFALKDQNKVVGAVLRSDHNRPLAISSMPKKAISLLSQTLSKKSEDLLGVVGEFKTAKELSETYAKAKALNCSLFMYQGIYELYQVKIPKSANTDMVVATLEHYDLVKDYLKGFILDCFPEEEKPEEEAERLAQIYIKNKSLNLLRNEGNFVSMAAKVRESFNAATISLVYTPQKYRQQGYGALITALTSQKILDEGKKMCNLFTDLKNPTSNSIYKKIGYKMIGESAHFKFIE